MIFLLTRGRNHTTYMSRVQNIVDQRRYILKIVDLLSQREEKSCSRKIYSSYGIWLNGICASSCEFMMFGSIHIIYNSSPCSAHQHRRIFWSNFLCWSLVTPSSYSNHLKVNLRLICTVVQASPKVNHQTLKNSDAWGLSFNSIARMAPTSRMFSFYLGQAIQNIHYITLWNRK